MKRVNVGRVARFVVLFAVLSVGWLSFRSAHASAPEPKATSEVVHGAPAHETEVEESGPPGPIKWFDTQILSNKQPPYLTVLFNFALLIGLYYWLGRKPIASALKARRDGIGKKIENAALILKEAKDRARRYRAKLDKVKEDAAQGKQALAFAGKGEAEQILRNADEKAARIKRDADFLLEQEGKQVHIDLLRETVDKAALEAEALLKKSVTAEDQERLAQAFLDQLARDYKDGSLAGGASSS
jgi:F-type H+-transporting ATPase subunit b